MMTLLQVAKERNLRLGFDEGKKRFIFYASILGFHGFGSIQRNLKNVFTLVLWIKEEAKECDCISHRPLWVGGKNSFSPGYCSEIYLTSYLSKPFTILPF